MEISLECWKSHIMLVKERLIVAGVKSEKPIMGADIDDGRRYTDKKKVL